MQDFDGRIALVTGGQGAIGSAVVAALRDRGARVICADGAAATGWRGADASALTAEGVRCDVSDLGDTAEFFAHVERELGAVDTLVNVAGVTSFGSAATLTPAEWQRVLNINLTGCFFACQAVMAGMKARRFGRIVNIGSVVPKVNGNARPWVDPAEQEKSSNVAYGVSKAGVHALTGFLAKELAAWGITVNAVAPGPIASAMTTRFPQHLRDLIPAGRMGEGKDVARAVLFLASREADFINGEILDVNGGMFCD